MTCEARQMSDMMVCDRCGIGWDVNDPEPPECRANLGTIHVKVDTSDLDEVADRFERLCAGIPRISAGLVFATAFLLGYLVALVTAGL